MIKPAYLNDKNFLKKFDLERDKEQFVRITVLDFKTEKTIASIEGKATGGSCNLSGTSNMRRTASCSIAVDFNGIKKAGTSDYEQYYDITEIRNLISINKKVRIDTGFTNTLSILGCYETNEIIWFPLGTYVIKSASISKNNSGVNISLTLNDKCALLNGDMGGTIPVATVFSEQEIYNTAKTKREVEKLLLKDIIKYIVVEFGGEDPDNVIITDIDEVIVKAIKWIGKTDVYLVETNGRKRLVTTGVVENIDKDVKTYKYGGDIGYMTEPFVYPGILECNAGESAAAVLDKIKNVLGNFEWFYDVWGRFHFQQNKNYLNEAPSKTIFELEAGDYYSRANLSMSEYTFDRETKTLLTSVSNAPQYQNIKNDFIVWGTRKSAVGVEKPIRYHLAFDQKPTPGKRYFALVYEDYRGLQNVIPLIDNYEVNDVPSTYTDKKKYYITNEKKIWAWDEERELFREYPDYEACYLESVDWRTELYYLGLWVDNKTFAKNYYAAELNAEWPKICDVKGKSIGVEENDYPIYQDTYREQSVSGYEYWLDFIENNPFNVDNIGRRTKVVSDKGSNCIFPVESPDYVYIEANGNAEEIDKKYDEAGIVGREAIQVSPEVFKYLTLGGSQNSAYDKIKELLYLHSTYNESISLSVIPIYHLEPNTRITVFDNETGVKGDYMIKTISLPLTPNGTSNISATKCVDKTF